MAGSNFSSPAGLGKMHYSFREMCKCSHGFVTPLLFMSSLFSIGKSKKKSITIYLSTYVGSKIKLSYCIGDVLECCFKPY